MKGLKIHIIVVVCLITLGAALLGQHYFYKQRVADPMLANLAQLPGVARVAFETVGGNRFIALNLQAGADLRTVYSTAQRLGEQGLGKAFGGVVIHDNRDQQLTDSYYQMHFYVQQAIATGMYTDMAAGIDQIAKQEKLSAHKVYVDESNVYIQLTQKDHSLFEVVARPQLVVSVQPEKGGTSTW